MPQLQGLPAIYAIHPHKSSSDQKHPLGTKGIASDGRIYRYCQAGGTALNPGQVQVAVDVLTNHEDLEVNTFEVGDKELTVSLAGTAVTTNQYAEGYVNVTDGTGEGIMYAIRSHGVSSAGSEDITVTLEEPIVVAAAAATTVTLIANKFRDILVSDGTEADLPVGVPNVTIDEDEYGWVQTGGFCSILVGNGDTTPGAEISIDTTDTGAVETRATVERTLGIQPAGVNADTDEYGAFYLTLDT